MTEPERPDPDALLRRVQAEEQRPLRELQEADEKARADTRDDAEIHDAREKAEAVYREVLDFKTEYCTRDRPNFAES